MCTLTVLRSDRGYLLATNRDESPSRGPARLPAEETFGARRALLPRDQDAGGTWVAVDDTGHTLSILNGDGPRPPRDPAAPSRGLLIPALLHDPRPEPVAESLIQRRTSGRMLEQPFKLVAVSPELEVVVFTWDGKSLLRDEGKIPFVITSSGVDPEEVFERRRAAFDDGRATHASPSAQDLLAFQSSHAASKSDEGDAFSVCMHREEARTVSTTLVEVSAGTVRMTYRGGQPCESAASVVQSLPRVRLEDRRKG